MTMPASVSGDVSIGHSGFSPSPITPTTTNVLVGGLPPHVAGDAIAVHVLGNSAHAGSIAQVSSSVLFGGKGAARLMDKGDCGALIMGSAGNVLIGG